MRFKFLILALVLAACSDVRSFDETYAQFQRDRDRLQPLAEAAVACDESQNFLAVETERDDCVGEISRQLHAMGYNRAFVSDGRWRVNFVNGDDGAPIGSVMSGISYRRVPGRPESYERVLTDAPHQWFYFQRD